MADLKVVPLNGPKNDATDEVVIIRLEEALNMAKHGGVDNCIVILTLKDGGIMDGWANDNKPYLMVGALESVKRDFMDSVIERR